MVAIAVTVAGVASCGLGGYRREREAKQQGRRAGFAVYESAMSQAEPTRRSYVVMVVVAIISGVLSALTNIALAYGGDVIGRARAAGAAQAWAPFALWPVVFLGGSIVNIGYSVFLLSRNKTWRKFKPSVREAVNPVLGGCMWMGGIALYSSATTFLGVLGVSIGFGLYTIVMILTNQFAGMFSREWHRMGAKAYGAFVVGIILLCMAVVIIASAHYFT
jgi:L-rhamnose-H+ transport protein